MSGYYKNVKLIGLDYSRENYADLIYFDSWGSIETISVKELVEKAWKYGLYSYSQEYPIRIGGFN